MSHEGKRVSTNVFNSRCLTLRLEAFSGCACGWHLPSVRNTTAESTSTSLGEERGKKTTLFSEWRVRWLTPMSAQPTWTQNVAAGSQPLDPPSPCSLEPETARQCHKTRQAGHQHSRSPLLSAWRRWSHSHRQVHCLWWLFGPCQILETALLWPFRSVHPYPYGQLLRA